MLTNISSKVVENAQNAGFSILAILIYPASISNSNDRKNGMAVRKRIPGGLGFNSGFASPGGCLHFSLDERAIFGECR